MIAIAGPAVGVAGAAGLPSLPVSPPRGEPQTTFVLSLPAAILRHADPEADLNVQIIRPPGSRRRCSPLRLPNAHVSGHGRSRVARFVLAPTLFARHGRGWCRGTYRLVAYAETIADDDEDTGAGGTDDVDLGRARFDVSNRAFVTSRRAVRRDRA